MVLYDVRCRDVARILASGPRTRKEIGTELRKIYPTLRARGAWVREVLLEWNPLVIKIGNDTWDLSDLGRTLVKLPGELGKPLTTEEKIFLLGLLLLDPRQRKITAELLALGKSSAADKWAVIQTTRVLEKLGVYERTPRVVETTSGV
ncbi:MAG: hypothetical protein QXU78_03115 [Sulfolobales archaeon]